MNNGRLSQPAFLPAEKDIYPPGHADAPWPLFPANGYDNGGKRQIPAGEVFVLH